MPADTKAWDEPHLAKPVQLPFVNAETISTVVTEAPEVYHKFDVHFICARRESLVL